jgi:nitroreductase
LSNSESEANAVVDWMRDTDWAGAIERRRSTRSYAMRPVDEEKMRLLRSFLDGMRLPVSEKVAVRLFKANPDKKLYMVFDAPPDNMAFLARTDLASISAAGFAGEIAILYAESLGLATCWYGHYESAELERVMPHLGGATPSVKWGYGKGAAEGVRAICVTPLGYWQREGVRLFDRVQEKLISHKRKPLEALLEGGVTPEGLSPEVRFALDLARLAPSAANSQHWRFHVGANGKAVSIAMPVGYRHIKWEHPDVDVGICASHFWLGLQMKNVECAVSLAEEEGRAVWRFELS